MVVAPRPRAILSLEVMLVQARVALERGPEHRPGAPARVVAPRLVGVDDVSRVEPPGPHRVQDLVELAPERAVLLGAEAADQVLGRDLDPVRVRGPGEATDQLGGLR